MNRQLLELEQAFKLSWRGFNPESYTLYLNQIDADQRLELLARLLGIELEFAFQPPSGGLSSDTRRLDAPAPDRSPSDSLPFNNEDRQISGDSVVDLGSGIDADGGDDDQRVKPCVPLFLLRFPELTGRSELVIRLIVLEYALRLRHDPRPPNPESYLPLCAQARDQLIRLLDLTENKLPIGRAANLPVGPVGRSDSTIKEASLSDSITLDPLPLNLGCFLLLRLVGRGGMGYVHAALDLRSTAQVAVKIMRRIDAWSIYRFIEEFRWLSQLSHPHLVKLYDTFCDGDIRYFSMELVEGMMIRDWFRKGAQRSESRWEKLRDVLGQLASAVEYLHEHQVVHCDLKCSNMMITAGCRAMLLDLGLAIRAGQDNRLVGTLQYMAPEVIQGGVAGYASDWYSFGVMIYEVLTDTFPPIHIELSESDPRQTNYQLDLDQVRQLLQACPEELANLCIDLLQSDPAQRPSGSDVVRRLTGHKQNLPVRKSLRVCWGRDDELEILTRATKLLSESTSHSRLEADPSLGGQPDDSGSTVASQASLVILHGEVGSGKTTLLNHWLQTFSEHSRLLLSVQCYRQDHTPFRLLNAIVQELTMAVPRLDVASWQPALEGLADEICVLFPQIQQLLPAREVTLPRSPAADRPASAAAQAASRRSLVQWLLQLSRQRPLIICVDDAHWADLESLQTLKQLLGHTGHFQGALVLIDESNTTCLHDVFRRVAEQRPRMEGGGRDKLEACPTGDKLEACPTDDKLEAYPTDDKLEAYPTVEIALSPLAQATCRKVLDYWCSSKCVTMDPSVAEDIAQRSWGNPFLLREIFRAYVHDVNTRGTSGKDRLPKDVQSSPSRSFSTLPQAAENVLQYLAVAGDALSFHQLQMVSRIFPDELQRLLDGLASQGWISSSHNDLDSHIEISHENFRRAILGSISPERTQRRHYRLARVLSCETPPAWACIGNHYWEAQHFREASACYMEAVRRAHAGANWEEALELLQRAEHPHAQRTASEKLHVLRLKADCLAGAGYSQAAAELYDQLQR